MLLNVNTRAYGRKPRNVGPEDRWVALGAGIVMLVLGFWRRSLSSLLLMPAGLYLLYRSLSGHCYIYEALGISTVSPDELLIDDVPPVGVGPYDEVAESSWESFPTSDAPAWTMGKRG